MRLRPSIRVLYLIDDTEPGFLPYYLAKLLKRLAPTQLMASVASIAPYGDGAERVQAEQFPVVSLDAPALAGPRALWSSCLALLRARALVEKFRPDVLHTLGGRARVIGSLAAVTRPSPALVSSFDERCGNRGFRRLLEGLVRATAIEPTSLVPDEDSLRAACESLPGHVHLHAVVGHGIDLSAARSSPVVGFDHLSDGHFDVGLPARAGRTDAMRHMLEAFKVFASFREDARLVVFGDRGTAQLAPWDEDLRLTDRIVYRPPPVEPAALLRRMSVVWVHGEPRPDPRAILEAMAVGVPVVCDHRTGLSDLVREIGGALMRDGAWPAQFAEATRDLAADRELAAAVGRAGRIVADRTASMRAHAERVRDVYERLTTGASTPSSAIQSSSTAMA